jgi:hypothetical protein
MRGKNCLNQSIICNDLGQRGQCIYGATVPMQTCDSYASLLRPIKCRFFICFLSLHHPNKRLKYFYFLFASLLIGSQKILRVEKILEGGELPPARWE